MILVHTGEQFSETPCLVILDPGEIHVNHVEDEDAANENGSCEGHESTRHGSCASQAGRGSSA